MEMQKAFWGLVIEQGKQYKQTPAFNFHVSRAVLDLDSYDKKPVSVKVHVDNGEFILCNLSESQTQATLDLVFNEGEKIKFFTTGGKANVHLTGYLMPEDDLSQLEDEEFSDEDCSDDENLIKQLNSMNQAKRKNTETLKLAGKDAKKLKTDDKAVAENNSKQQKVIDVDPKQLLNKQKDNKQQQDNQQNKKKEQQQKTKPQANNKVAPEMDSDDSEVDDDLSIDEDDESVDLNAMMDEDSDLNDEDLESEDDLESDEDGLDIVKLNKIKNQMGKPNPQQPNKQNVQKNKQNDSKPNKQNQQKQNGQFNANKQNKTPQQMNKNQQNTPNQNKNQQKPHQQTPFHQKNSNKKGNTPFQSGNKNKSFGSQNKSFGPQNKSFGSQNKQAKKVFN